MRKTLEVCLLLLLLTGSASAGEMPNFSPVPPPQQQASAVQEPTDDAQEPMTGGEIPNDVTDSLTGIASELLAVLPSLL